MAQKKTKATKKKATSKKQVKKVASKKRAPKVAPKKQAPKVAKKKVVEHKAETLKPTSKKRNKKDILIISILSVILVVIIVLLITIPKPEDNDPNNNVTDVNTIFDDDDAEYTEEEIYAMLEDIQYRLNKQIISEQLSIFEPWYEELSLDKETMSACIAENNYTDKNVTIEGSEILSKIMADLTLAGQRLGYQGTPGIILNNYKLDGFVDYNALKKRIDAALLDVDNNIPTIDNTQIDVNSYEYDSEQDPVFYIVYNTDHQFAKDEVQNTINNTKLSEYGEMFTKLYDNVTLEHTHFLDAPQNIKDLMAMYNLNQLPFYFIEGDISKIGFSETDLNSFNEIFFNIPEGGYTISIQTTYLLDASFVKDERDYVVGPEDAKVTVYFFTDYGCGYCKKFEQEVVPKIEEDYFEDGLVNIVIKDFVIYEAQSLFPTVFARCAQQQGKYFETHKKLFEHNQEFGQDLINNLMSEYTDEIEALQRYYEKLQT